MRCNWSHQTWESLRFSGPLFSNLLSLFLFSFHPFLSAVSFSFTRGSAYAEPFTSQQQAYIRQIYNMIHSGTTTTSLNIPDLAYVGVSLGTIGRWANYTTIEQVNELWVSGMGFSEIDGLIDPIVMQRISFAHDSLSLFCHSARPQPQKRTLSRLHCLQGYRHCLLVHPFSHLLQLHGSLHHANFAFSLQLAKKAKGKQASRLLKKPLLWIVNEYKNDFVQFETSKTKNLDSKQVHSILRFGISNRLQKLWTTFFDCIYQSITLSFSQVITSISSIFPHLSILES